METRVFSNQRPTHTAAVSTKKNVKSPIRWFVLLAVLLLPTLSMGQVKAQTDGKDNQKEYVRFNYVDGTKTYPEGNQITYVKATGLPEDKAVADEMEKYLISVMRVSRVKVYFGYDMFLLDADADINPEWVVDEMNVFLRKFYGVVDDSNMEIRKEKK